MFIICVLCLLFHSFPTTLLYRVYRKSFWIFQSVSKYSRPAFDSHWSTAVNYYMCGHTFTNSESDRNFQFSLSQRKEKGWATNSRLGYSDLKIYSTPQKAPFFMTGFSLASSSTQPVDRVLKKLGIFFLNQNSTYVKRPKRVGGTCETSCIKWKELKASWCVTCSHIGLWLGL